MNLPAATCHQYVQDDTVPHMRIKKEFDWQEKIVRASASIFAKESVAQAQFIDDKTGCQVLP
jgi:hypothetical protein